MRINAPEKQNKELLQWYNYVNQSNFSGILSWDAKMLVTFLQKESKFNYFQKICKIFSNCKCNMFIRESFVTAKRHKDNKSLKITWPFLMKIHQVCLCIPSAATASSHPYHSHSGFQSDAWCVHLLPTPAESALALPLKLAQGQGYEGTKR